MSQASLLSAALQAKQSPVPKVLAGFDGYVDRLYRVLRSRTRSGKIPFEGIGPFGAELMGRAGKSGGFELDRISLRLGGNAPLMARALAGLGLDVDCVGSLGRPALESVFEELGTLCRLHSVAPAAFTVALEFEDGKIMLGDTQTFEGLTWDSVKQALGPGKIPELCAGAGLLALVNWANMAHATGLWQGLLEEGLKKPGLRGKRLFFDLADLNRCGKAETLELLGLLKRFREFGEVTLGINENEAWQLAEKLGWDKAPGAELKALGQRLYDALGLDCLVLHPRLGAWVFENGSSSSVEGRLVEKPLLSTGGGDNFNAGYCAGILMGLKAADAAAMAVLVSSQYVAKGKSPGRQDLLAALKG